jgi:hypothetical protein
MLDGEVLGARVGRTLGLSDVGDTDGCEDGKSVGFVVG